MTETSDAELLRRYARENSGEAFATIVERHVSLVHSVALRHTSDQQHAQDITQAVFILLARKAAALGPKTVLPGWLYHTARLTAANFRRSEIRRIHREQEAYMQTIPEESTPDVLWPELLPLLDDAMSRLGAHDRNALVLRFFQNKTIAQVGVAMGLEERAAQKRILRALEKLRKNLGRHGVNSTAESIAAAISSNSIQVAPVALAKSVAAVAIYKGATATSPTLALVKAAARIMTFQKLKIAAVAAFAVMFATGATATAIDNKSQKNPSFPYRMADDYWQVIKSVDTNKLIVRVFLASNNKADGPGSLSLTIRSIIKGQIPVQVSTNGEVIDIPHDPALRRENPSVTMNQLHGSVTFLFNIPMPQGLTFQYSQLVGGITEMNNAIAKLNKSMTPSDLGWINYVEWLFSPRMKVNDITIDFPRSGAHKATLEIMAASGIKTYTANPNGIIKLKLDKKLLLENPQIQFSEKPIFIMPDLSM
jgi:RNA polymerase sigma factor (sigma-70 family)